MKVLLLHPDDSPFEGPWSEIRWDYVIDLGWAGSHAYTEWEHRLGCPVRGLYGFAHGPEDFRRIADTLKPRLGKLVDAFGLDWWEILAPLHFQPMLELALVRRALHEVGPADMAATRAHSLVSVFTKAAGHELQVFLRGNESSMVRQLLRFKTAASLMSPPQLLQASLDKWDMDYRFRAHLGRRDSRSLSQASVLLPSGYANVTRMITAYANLLPERNFLLVTTRAGGTMSYLPQNIRSSALAGYAPKSISDSTRKEVRILEQRWSILQKDALGETEELTRASEGGSFLDIGKRFEPWLRIRDAWNQVLDKEQISAVLCGDENNPTNRIPALLARKRNLPTVLCDHGALDVLLPLRAPACDTYLVKGEMERDFMTRTFSTGSSRIVVGAPAEHFSHNAEKNADTGAQPAAPPGTIVFFSEQHELTYGRTRVLYQEILPHLCAVAQRYGKRVVVKLHPFESPASRRKMIAAVLPEADRKLIDLVHGPLTPELMRNVWFGVTVESGVAVDCAIRGIPCFLCGWFITPLSAYGEQFVRYGAARLLESPQKIGQIPETLQDFCITPQVRRGLWNPIAPATLEALLRNS
jgi:hypothetical protein